MKSKYHFFVAYPRDGEGETKAILNIVKKRLNIDYELWSYADVQDETEYYQEVVEPAIQDAEFVLAFVGKQSEDDYLLNESIRLCSNLNKSMVPIKVGSGRIKEKNWGFRTKVVDFYDESQRIGLIEQMHGWLGLTKVGDVYGSKVVIKANTPSVIMRNDEVLGNDTGDGLNCVFAKGCRDITVKSKDGCWNRYRYQVADNDSELQFDASLDGVRQLAKYGTSAFMFNPDSNSIPRWDLTNRKDFMLVSSSEDQKKQNIIVNSYNNYYCSKLKPYPEFHPETIEHSKGLCIFFWIISILLCFVALGTGLLIIAGYYIIRHRRDKAVERRNERRRQQLISDTDNWNDSVWRDANKRMNKELDLQGLSHSDLRYLGTPSSYLDTVHYEYKQIG